MSVDYRAREKAESNLRDMLKAFQNQKEQEEREERASLAITMASEVGLMMPSIGVPGPLQLIINKVAMNAIAEEQYALNLLEKRLGEIAGKDKDMKKHLELINKDRETTDKILHDPKVKEQGTVFSASVQRMAEFVKEKSNGGKPTAPTFANKADEAGYKKLREDMLKEQGKLGIAVIISATNNGVKDQATLDGILQHSVMQQGFLAGYYMNKKDRMKKEEKEKPEPRKDSAPERKPGEEGMRTPAGNRFTAENFTPGEGGFSPSRAVPAENEPAAVLAI